MKDNASNQIQEGIRDTLAKPARRYELDWLRVIVIINLVPWHVAWLMVFIPSFSYISQGGFEISILRCYVVSVIRWQMPLLFFIAGVSACVSLTVRSPKIFIKERVKRLFVPLIFFMTVCFPVSPYFWPGICESKSLLDYFGRFWSISSVGIKRIRVSSK